MITAENIHTSVASLPPGTRGVDANAHITPQIADRFYAAGYRFVIRYVRRAQPNSQDLTTGEVLAILGSQLGLGVVQHVALPGWVPAASLGTAYGATAANEARAVGLPVGMTLWCDLEGVDPRAGTPGVIGFCNAWYDRVQAAGYVPGLYVGDSCGLTAQQLYYNLRFARFWRAYNLNADQVPAVRGACMTQLPYPVPANRVPGVPFEYDEDVVVGDAFGGSPNFLLPWAP